MHQVFLFTLTLFLFTAFQPPAQAANPYTEEFACAWTIAGQTVSLTATNYHVETPTNNVPRKGVFYFLPGFADVGYNHTALIAAVTRAGFTFISPTYPSHGDATGIPLAVYSVPQIAQELIAKVATKAAEKFGKENWIIGGWSTGGTLAEYVLQKELLKNSGIGVRAAVEITPGIPVKMLVGRFGVITRRSLAGNSLSFPRGAFRPPLPMLALRFAGSLYLESQYIFENGFEHPSQIPTLILSTNERDRYVQSNRVISWAEDRAARGANIWTRAYPTPNHALEWDPNYGNDAVQSIADFISLAVNPTAGVDLNERFGRPKVDRIAPWESHPAIP